MKSKIQPFRVTLSTVIQWAYFWNAYLQRVYVTLFGKSRLNENCVEPFFIATHLETLKCIGERSKCI